MPTPPLLLRTAVITCAIAALLCVASARAEVTASNAWVRGTVGGQQATGAFMSLRSTTANRLWHPAETQLDRVMTDVDTELHEVARGRPPPTPAAAKL